MIVQTLLLTVPAALVLAVASAGVGDLEALPGAAVAPYTHTVRITERFPGLAIGSFRKAQGSGSLRVRIDATSPDPGRTLVRHYTAAEGLGNPVSYSGLPLGDAVYSVGGDGARIIRTHDGQRVIEVVAVYFAERTGTTFRWRRDDPEGDEERVEGVARYLTARQAYRATRPGAPANVAGRPLRARSIAGRPEAWVAVQDWAAARGAALRVNARRGTAQLTLGGTVVIVPLGARSIKVGERWVDLPAPVAWWDSGWYVPLDALPR